MKTQLGRITKEEGEKLKIIDMKKRALRELLISISERKTSTELYERIVSDYTDTTTQMNDWWQSIAKSRGWEFDSSDSWLVDYNENTVYLVNADT